MSKFHSVFLFGLAATDKCYRTISLEYIDKGVILVTYGIFNYYLNYESELRFSVEAL